jgi:light-regulated signal transduction histidine kinase (bacteriophytochrome)
LEEDGKPDLDSHRNPDGENRLGSAGLWKHRLKDGSIITVEILRSPVTFQGRSAELVVATDVSARIRTENCLSLRYVVTRTLAESNGESLRRVMQILGQGLEFELAQLWLIESTLVVSRNEWKYVAEMVTEFDRQLPLVPCIAGEFNQVILNLVVNAAHAIADVVRDTGEKGRITVSTRQEKGWAEIGVADTGAGIPEPIRGRIFDPFFTTKEVGRGSGQGLSIAHAVIVRNHGGTIHFQTESGAGTTFIVRLPLEEQRGPR